MNTDAPTTFYVVMIHKPHSDLRARLYRGTLLTRKFSPYDSIAAPLRLPDSVDETYSRPMCKGISPIRKRPPP